jgi:hypothetical protein
MESFRHFTAGNTDLWLKDVVDEVASALDLVNKDFVDEGIDSLLASETKILGFLSIPYEKNPDLLLHALNWILLQRAAILCELTEFREARELLEHIILGILVDTDNHNNSDVKCFCQEHIFATIEFAQLEASVGDFASAIMRLKNLSRRLNEFHYSREQMIPERVSSLVEMWGSALGYDNLDLKNELLTSKTRESFAVVDFGQHWRFPFALRGPLYCEFESETRNGIEYLIGLKESDLHPRYEATKKLCSIVEKWIHSMPYSIVAKEFQERFLMSKAEMEVELNFLDAFEETILEVNVLLEEMLNNFPLHVNMQLRTTRWLSSLSRTILFHNYVEADGLGKFYRYGANCISVATSALEVIRERVAVTQALALRECIVSNLGAIASDMVSENSYAYWLRGRRDVILSVLISSDPRNDLGRRLSKSYETTVVVVDPELESQIKNWNWSIVPLI